MTVNKVSVQEKGSFNNAALHPLQSWQWGEFREKNGNKVIRIGVFEKGKIVNSLQIIFSRIPKTQWTIGTVIKGPLPTKEILNELKKVGDEQKAIFIKLEPNIIIENLTKEEKQRTTNLIKKSGCKEGRKLFTPTTFWIDLTKSEQDLLKSFSSKTRYNIRLAEKHGVKIVEDNSSEAFERYLELTKETVERQGFYAHTEKYHRLMWKYLHSDMVENKEEPIARLLTAVYKDQIITTWIIFVWHDFLYYPYGASSQQHKKVMANNLMMWEAIKYGKALGLKKFDLWGREEGKGFTKFKEGYNPKVVEFLGTWDLPVSSLYSPYTYAEKLRWYFLRGRTKLGFVKPKF